MNAKQKEAIKRIKESLEDFPDSRMAQHVLSQDLEILIKLVEKCEKK
jgi:hypothetical protein